MRWADAPHIMVRSTIVVNNLFIASFYCQGVVGIGKVHTVKGIQ